MIGRNKVELTHLHFADDTLIFLPQHTKKLLNYRSLLDCFGLTTGLEINYNKSSLLSWGIHNSWVEDMDNLLGCKVENLPNKYLGMPLEISCKSRKVWNLVIERIEQKLTI